MNTGILILGGGLSAYAAAWEAVKAGARVDLFCDGAGASPFIHGICLTLGEGDGEELFYRDTLLSGCGQGDPDLVRALCRGAGEIPEYLASLGLSPDREEGKTRLLKPLGASVPRVACVENAVGPAVLRELKRRLEESGLFTAHPFCRAVDLVKKDGRVAGARLYDRKKDLFFGCAAPVTVLAVGGFCRLFPETTTPPDLGGDGVAMAARAGAELVDMEFIQFEPLSAVAPERLVGKSVITTLFYEGAALRNARGERFLLRYGPEGERLQKDVLSLRMAREILSGGAGEHGGLYMDCTGVPEERLRGVYAPYRDRYLSVGIDLKTTPVEVAPAAHTSLGGVRIDRLCRTGVPGLVACGEVTGGLHGANRMGGNAGLETMVFGRIAGRTAASSMFEMPEIHVPEEAGTPARPGIREERTRLGEILRQGLGVIRSGDRVQRALEETEELLKGEFSETSFEELRLKNDLSAARFALIAAGERRGDLGCHRREDAQEEKTPYRLVLTERDGAIRIEKRKL